MNVRYIHWKEEEAESRAGLLVSAGFDVDFTPFNGPPSVKKMEKELPGTVVIDLSRLPSQGRDLGVMLRKRKGTRMIPLVFVDGLSEKVENVRKLLPDASYCRWEELPEAVRDAGKKTGTEVVVPESVFAAYSGKPIAEKLGLKTDNTLAVINSPETFEQDLARFPSGINVAFEMVKDMDTVLWFAESPRELEHGLTSIVEVAKQVPVWIAWPKGGSVKEGELTQQVVRQEAMALGLVDYKICSVNDTWSALLFTWRGEDDSSD
jgi:hypothetical protein